MYNNKCFYQHTLSAAEKAAVSFADNIKQLFLENPDAYDDCVNLIFELFDMIEDNAVYEFARVIFEIFDLPRLEALPEYATCGILHEMFFWHMKNILDRELHGLGGE